MHAEPKTGRTRAVLGAMALLASGALLLLVFLLRGDRLGPDRPPGPDPFVPTELAPSAVNVEVRYSLDRLRQDLEGAIPESYGDLSERRSDPSTPGMSYAVATRRENLRLEARDDLLHVTAVLGYQGRLWLRTPFGSELEASCEHSGPADGMPRARLELSTPIALDPEWRIRSEMRVVAVEPLSAEERCRLSVPPFSLDATALVMDLVGTRLQESTSQLDSLLASIDVRSTIEERWHEMRDPVRLADDVWLLVDPISIRRGPVGLRSDGGGGAIQLGISLVARPRVVVGERPAPAGAPALSLHEGPVDDEFTLLVETRIDYAAASRLLDRDLRGREFQVGLRTVRVTEARVFPASDGRLGVEIGVSGGVRGRLYLVGRPALDSTGRVITVPDLRFSAATRNVLVRAAVWLLDAAFPDRVRRYTRWPADEALARARSLASQGLNRSLAPGATLSGRVTGLALQDVQARPEAIVLRVAVQGVASVDIGAE